MGICERLPDSVSTEFRLHGIPYVFCASISSVFRAESPKIPRDFAEFRLLGELLARWVQ
jgi:hypothetical protein